MANSSGFDGSNFAARFTGAMTNLGVSASSAAVAMGGFNAASGALGFPSADAAMDRMMALERAMTDLREGEGPPDEIRALAADRAKELDVQVSFLRTISREAAVLWQVAVRTKRGTLHASPSLTEKEHASLAHDLLPVAAWKNAMREVGLL